MSAEDGAINISQISFSAFDESFSAPVQTSTPTKRRKVTTPKSPAARRVFKVPSFKAPRPKKFICNECSKGYAMERPFKEHIRRHAIERLSYRYPDREKIMENIGVIDMRILNKMTQSPAYGVRGEIFKDIVLKIQDAALLNTKWNNFRRDVCDYFLDAVCHQKFLLPSFLLNTVSAATESLLSSEKRRCDLLEHITQIVFPERQSEVIQCFICDYILKFSIELVSFISFSVRQGNHELLGKKTVIIDEEDRQVIHNCAGSVMRGFLNMGKRYPSNECWKRVTFCINSRILENEVVSAASAKDKQWTESIDRGKLLKIGATALEFFVCVAKCCANCESLDGSLSYESVMKTVHKVGGAAIWDEVVGETLSNKESLSFMNGVVRSFSQTCGNGLTRKSINLLAGRKAVASVSLRHRVAPR